MLASFELRLEYLGLLDTEGALDGGPILSRLKIKIEYSSNNAHVGRHGKSRKHASIACGQFL